MNILCEYLNIFIYLLFADLIAVIIVSFWNRGNLKYLAFLEGNILSSQLTFCSRKDGVPLIQYGSHIVGRQQTGPLQFYSDVGWEVHAWFLIER